MKKKILVIEDNPEMRENTSEILELSNYNVFTAANGKEGVDLAKREKPDLIICDIMMPELDGYGVLHMLGKDTVTSLIPFIFLTAKAEKNDFRKGMAMGADDYLTKPFDDLELLDAVETRLRKTDLLKTEFEKSAEGMDHFFEQVGELNQIETFTNSRSLRTYKKKETLFSEGNYPNFLFLINKGTVKTFKTNEQGKELITGVHKEGDFIGYATMLEDSTYPESATVLEEAEIYSIPRQDFFALINNNRFVSEKFVKMISNNLVETEERLIQLAYNSVRKRVAEAVVMLHERFKKENETVTQIPISREDLANIVGTATESVIRTLSDFKDESLIDIRKGGIYVLQLEKLKKLKN